MSGRPGKGWWELGQELGQEWSPDLVLHRCSPHDVLQALLVVEGPCWLRVPLLLLKAIPGILWGGQT